MAAATKIPAWLTKTKWLEAQRAVLLSERTSYLSSSAARTLEADELLANKDAGDAQFDEEGGEGDTISVERDRAKALSGKAQDKVYEIEDALERLNAGTYGLCVAGGCVIPKERLEALPMAAKCVRHQTAMF